VGLSLGCKIGLGRGLKGLTGLAFKTMGLMDPGEGDGSKLNHIADAHAPKTKLSQKFGILMKKIRILE